MAQREVILYTAVNKKFLALIGGKYLLPPISKNINREMGTSLGTVNKLLMTITCINAHLRHQEIFTYHAMPAISFFVAEHLYSVLVTSYF